LPNKRYADGGKNFYKFNLAAQPSIVNQLIVQSAKPVLIVPITRLDYAEFGIIPIEFPASPIQASCR